MRLDWMLDPAIPYALIAVGQCFDGAGPDQLRPKFLDQVENMLGLLHLLGRRLAREQ